MSSQREDLTQAINTMQRAMNGPAAAYRQYLSHLIEAAKRELAAPALLSSGGPAQESSGELLAELQVRLRHMCEVPASCVLGNSPATELLTLQGKVASFAAAWNKAFPALAAAPVSTSLGGPAQLDSLSAYADLAAEHDDALPLTATVEEGGLIQLHMRNGFPVEATPEFAQFVADACNLAGADFLADLRAENAKEGVSTSLGGGAAAPDFAQYYAPGWRAELVKEDKEALIARLRTAYILLDDYRAKNRAADQLLVDSSGAGPRWVPVAEWPAKHFEDVEILYVLHKGWANATAYWDDLGKLWRRTAGGNPIGREVRFVTSVPRLPELPTPKPVPADEAH